MATNNNQTADSYNDRSGGDDSTKRGSASESRPGKVAALCFRRSGSLYWFNANDLEVRPGEFVVADTEKGPDIGQVVHLEDQMAPGRPEPTKSLKRKANHKDLQRRRQLHQKASRTLRTAEKKVTEHSLEMKLVRAEYTLDGHHLTIFFTADGRVDFRELVHNLASAFHCRIELRQIGVRDEAKIIGGLGPCGQQLCCERFLRDFEPVGIRLAKDQDLPLNPEKISGVCGRLMCCLRYETDVYSVARNKLPKVGDQVQTAHGQGPVVGRNLLKQEITVRLGPEHIVSVPAAEVQPAAEDTNNNH